MLKTILVFFILSVSGIYLQSSLLPRILLLEIAPDFILILVVWVALSSEVRSALLGAFFLGLLSDFASGVYLGPQAFGSVAACVLVQGFSRHVYADRSLSIAMVAGIASVIKQLSAIIMVISFTGFQLFFDLSILLMAGQAVFTALCAPLVLKFILLPGKKRIL
jgi:rod shape-determining protein MreD